MNTIVVTALNMVGDYKFKNKSWFDVIETKIAPFVKDNIRFNFPVTSINYEGDIVKIETKSGEIFEADKALVTVPITILQKELIKFNPIMPSEKVKAINAEKMPEGFKLFIEFSEKFYNDVILFQGIMDLLTEDLDQSTYYNVI